MNSTGQDAAALAALNGYIPVHGIHRNGRQSASGQHGDRAVAEASLRIQQAAAAFCQDRVRRQGSDGE